MVRRRLLAASHSQVAFTGNAARFAKAVRRLGKLDVYEGSQAGGTGEVGGGSAALPRRQRRSLGVPTFGDDGWRLGSTVPAAPLLSLKQRERPAANRSSLADQTIRAHASIRDRRHAAVSSTLIRGTSHSPYRGTFRKGSSAASSRDRTSGRVLSAAWLNHASGFLGSWSPH